MLTYARARARRGHEGSRGKATKGKQDGGKRGHGNGIAAASIIPASDPSIMPLMGTNVLVSWLDNTQRKAARSSACACACVCVPVPVCVCVCLCLCVCASVFLCLYLYV